MTPAFDLKSAIASLPGELYGALAVALLDRANHSNAEDRKKIREVFVALLIEHEEKISAKLTGDWKALCTSSHPVLSALTSEINLKDLAIRKLSKLFQIVTGSEEDTLRLLPTTTIQYQDLLEQRRVDALHWALHDVAEGHMDRPCVCVDRINAQAIEGYASAHRDEMALTNRLVLQRSILLLPPEVGQWCPNLEEIVLTNGHFCHLDLSAFNQLKSAALDRNRLRSLECSKNLQLKELSVGGNKLRSLDCSKNELLEVLHIGCNPLQSLFLPPSIKRLHISLDQWPLIKPLLPHLPHLEVVAGRISMKCRYRLEYGWGCNRDQPEKVEKLYHLCCDHPAHPTAIDAGDWETFQQFNSIIRSEILNVANHISYEEAAAPFDFVGNIYRFFSFYLPAKRPNPAAFYKAIQEVMAPLSH
ncbi:MAG: hypothetical protein JSS61_01345 [Verrucomicrobia bacterium]|nr:hypothetical protein [Verrucomicrobiota bacterium]